MNEQSKTLAFQSTESEVFDFQLHDENAEIPQTPTKQFSAERYAAKKNAERQSAYEMAERAAQAIVKNGGYFKNYLNTLSRVERYSATNTLLIYAQSPNATRMRTREKWAEENIAVKPNEREFVIVERVDYQRKDGTMGFNYNAKLVFDISQTNAKPQEPPKHSTYDLCSALMKSSPVKVVAVEELSDANAGNTCAHYNPEQGVIEVTRGMDAESIFRCLSHEVALARLEQAGIENGVLAAYAASYTLCQKYGVDTPNYDFSQVPEYFANKDSKELRSELAPIRDTVAELATSMYKALEPQDKGARGGGEAR